MAKTIVNLNESPADAYRRGIRTEREIIRKMLLMATSNRAARDSVLEYIASKENS